MKADMDEAALVADIRILLQTRGVAMVADFTDRRTSYLAISIQMGYEVDFREKIAGLGWSRVAEIPDSAKPGSRILGTPVF